MCGLVRPSAALAASAAALPAAAEPSERREPRRRLEQRLAALARELEGVCRLYTTEGEKLFLGQEISAIYRRRRAVEPCLARAPLPAELEPAWSRLHPALLRLHQAVDWREFNAWYLEREGDSE